MPEMSLSTFGRGKHGRGTDEYRYSTRDRTVQTVLAAALSELLSGMWGIEDEYSDLQMISLAKRELKKLEKLLNDRAKSKR